MMARLFAAIVLPWCAACLVPMTRAADYVVVPSDGITPGARATVEMTTIPGAGNVTGFPAPPGVNGYKAVVRNGVSFFRVFGPLGGDPCGKRVRTSVTARAHNCQIATNGGPFNMKDGSCVGTFISQGKVYGSGWGVQFGVTGDGRWIVGTLNASVVEKFNVTESVNGFGWLVRGGKVVVPKPSPSAFVAPRTTIELLLLEVDGCETRAKCGYTIGATEYDMANLLVRQGAFYAINLDGGGSSSFVRNGTVINHPTDDDIWWLKKERAVTLITCLL